MNKNTENKYPTLKVITLYSLLGGFVGTLLIFIYIIPNIFTNNDLNFDDIKFLITMFVACIMIGTIPSLLTGIMIAIFKIKIVKYKDYIKLFLIGVLACLLFSLPLSILGYDEIKIKLDTAIELIGVLLLFSLIGGMSSTILAKFILPKS